MANNKLSVRMLENNADKPILLTVYRLDGRTTLMQGSSYCITALSSGMWLYVVDSSVTCLVQLDKFSIPFVDPTGEYVKVTLKEEPDGNPVGLS